MMKYLLLLLFFRANFSAIYKMEKSVPKGEIVYTGDEPSKLSCIQKSFFYKAEAIYDGRRCTCVKKVVHGGDEQTLDNEIEGSAYSLVGDINQKKMKNPGAGSQDLIKYESCQQIANHKPSALSGLYTIRYNASKSIEVYCDMNRSLKVFTEREIGADVNKTEENVKAGWMLVANVSFTKTISEDETVKITNAISSNIDELKNAATKNFLFDLRQLLHFPDNFHKIRIFCKRERTVHILGLEKVVDYFIAKTDKCPASCGTFKRFVDDDSHLGGRCEEWKNQKWGCRSLESKRMYDFPFYANGYDFGIYGRRISCDDKKSLAAGTWQIFVR